MDRPVSTRFGGVEVTFINQYAVKILGALILKSKSYDDTQLLGDCIPFPTLEFISITNGVFESDTVERFKIVS